MSQKKQSLKRRIWRRQMEIPEHPWLLPRGTCIVCHFFVPFKDMTIEHMVPRAQGGDGNESNLAPAHADCNVLKADRTLEEYMTFQAANQPRKKGQKKRKFEVLDYTNFPDVVESNDANVVQR